MGDDDLSPIDVAWKRRNRDLDAARLERQGQTGPRPERQRTERRDSVFTNVIPRQHI